MNRDDEFRANLALGRRWEKAVYAWLQRSGWYLMPDYAGDNSTGAPRLRGDKDGIVLPDILGADHGVMKYVEVKYRTRTVTFRRLGQEVTGKIAERNWNEYLKVEKQTGIPVWIVFVQKIASEIVGAPIKHIARHCHHGIGAGVGYINIDYECLDRLASLAELQQFDPDLHGPDCACETCFSERTSTRPSRTVCKSCGVTGQSLDIHAPSFVGPLGFCVPCFRREWGAERTPAWTKHGPRCVCAICFASKGQ